MKIEIIHEICKVAHSLPMDSCSIGKGDKGGRGLGDKWFRDGGGGGEGAEVWRRDLN